MLVPIFLLLIFLRVSIFFSNCSLQRSLRFTHISFDSFVHNTIKFHGSETYCSEMMQGESDYE